jgi:fibronectin-binding autotransporter adhesin
LFTILNHTVPGMAIGSIEGDGTIQLGAVMLTVGTNDRSTTFSGLIEDSPKGFLSKVGAGTFTITGANTYTGGTTVEAGGLIVANEAGSATGTGPVQVNVGTLGGGGLITGAVTVGTGGGAGAFLSPATAATGGHRTLTIQSALTMEADATYTVTFNAKSSGVRTDEVVANGVTINNATIAIEATARGHLREGTVITLISNTSADPISGTFQNLPEGAIVTVNGNNLEASYTGGDGNDLTLTVIP